MLEPFDEAHPTAAHEPRAHAVAESVHVKEWKNGQVPNLTRDAPADHEVRRVRGEVVVREHGPLRPPRGPGRVDDRRWRIAVDRQAHAVRRLTRRLGDETLDIDGVGSGKEREMLRGRDGEARLSIRDNVAYLSLPIEHVDRHDDHAGADAGEEDLDELHAVREVDTESFAPSDTARRESTRHAIGASVQLAEREGLEAAVGSVVLERDDTGPAEQGKIEEIAKLHGRGFYARSRGTRGALLLTFGRSGHTPSDLRKEPATHTDATRNAVRRPP